MRAIVLSAGQGKRLLPLTVEQPKCLLRIRQNRSILELQLRALARCGVSEVRVVAGFGVQHVERLLAATPIPGLDVELVYNPFYGLSDNLATCWTVREAMRGDFLLLNGDTLFEDRVLARLLEAPAAPVRLTIDRKDRYDADDMKVSLDGRGRLLAVAKDLPADRVDGESIGLTCFRGDGPAAFRAGLERAIRQPGALRAWYLAVIADLAGRLEVATTSIHGLWWREIDSPRDLEEARASSTPRLPRGRSVLTGRATTGS